MSFRMPDIISNFINFQQNVEQLELLWYYKLIRIFLEIYHYVKKKKSYTRHVFGVPMFKICVPMKGVCFWSKVGEL